MSEKKAVQEEVEEIEQEESFEEEQSYDDAFDAQWGKESPGKAAPSEPSSSEDEEEEEEEEQPAKEEEDSGQDDHKDEPEPKQPAKEAPPADPYAWINSLPEEVQEQAKALRNQANSHQGRATAFQRRVNELTDELRRLEQARAEAPAEQKPSASESAAPEQLKKLERLKEDFPEFAEALEEVISFERKEVERRVKETLKPLEEERAKKRSDDFNKAVDEGAEEIFHTTETGLHWKAVVDGDDFRAWLQMQPKSVQQAARAPDPDEAIYVLRRYEDDYQRAVKEMGLDNQGKESQGAVSEEVSRAEELKRKRKQRQATSTAPGSKPAEGGRDSHGGDYEAEFNSMWS